MKKFRIAVIMAGGSGTRFWPVSRKERPKQLLKLTSPDQTLLEQAVERVTPLVPAEHVFIVTAKHLQAPIRQAGLQLPEENVIAEPSKRNTAGCLAYTAAYLLERFDATADEIIMGVLTADQQIEDRSKFLGTVAAAYEAAEVHNALVTIGIKPNRAETGYGYIEMSEDAAAISSSTSEFPVFPVLQFREKPDEAQARQFLQSGRFLWNSGMFFWRISTFFRELEQENPEYAGAVLGLVDALQKKNWQDAEEIFHNLPDISIDYALLERARNVLVAPGEFVWDDVGAWDALDRTYPHNERGNIASGDPVLIDSSDCIVYNEAGRKMAVAAIGLKGMIIVTTEDAVLVVPKDRAQDVKKAVQILKDRGAQQL